MYYIGSVDLLSPSPRHSSDGIDGGGGEYSGRGDVMVAEGVNMVMEGGVMVAEVKVRVLCLGEEGSESAKKEEVGGRRPRDGEEGPLVGRDE